jgi:hypothetical protein
MSRQTALSQQIAVCQAALQATRLQRRRSRQSAVSRLQPPLLLLAGFAGGCLLQQLTRHDIGELALSLMQRPDRTDWWYALWLALLQRLTPRPDITADVAARDLHAGAGAATQCHRR